MTRPRVYIAGPYTIGDVTINIRAAITAAEQVIEAGGAPYVPHLTHLWHVISPHEYAYWLALDLAWLRICDCLIRLPGHSNGADMEVVQAQRCGLPVFTGEFAVQHFAAWQGAGSAVPAAGCR